MVMDGWTTTGVARIGQTAATKLYQPPVSAPPTTGATATGTVNKLPLALLQLDTVSACSLSLAAVIVVCLCHSWLLWLLLSLSELAAVIVVFVRADCSDCCCVCQSWLQWSLSLSEMAAVIVVCQSQLQWLLSVFVRADSGKCCLSFCAWTGCSMWSLLFHVSELLYTCVLYVIMHVYVYAHCSCFLFVCLLRMPDSVWIWMKTMYWIKDTVLWFLDVAAVDIAKFSSPCCACCKLGYICPLSITLTSLQ